MDSYSRYIGSHFLGQSGRNRGDNLSALVRRKVGSVGGRTVGAHNNTRNAGGIVLLFFFFTSEKTDYKAKNNNADKPYKHGANTHQNNERI